MKIMTSFGVMNLDGDARPSTDDMNDIMSSLTNTNDNGRQFQAICDASADFPSATNAEFAAACEKWLAAQ